MKKTYFDVKRLEVNKYSWESETHSEKCLNQTELLLLLGGVLAATILNAMSVGDELNVDMKIKII